MVSEDLPLLLCWLSTPHVVQWWGDTREQYALVRDDLVHPAMDQFIVTADNRPFAYIQSYSPDDWAPHPFGQQPKGTRGIDQFIGEADMIDRGHGSAFIRAFIGALRAAGAPRVLTDPDPANIRAIRAYEKAGLRRDRIIETPEGPALLMVSQA